MNRREMLAALGTVSIPAGCSSIVSSGPAETAPTDTPTTRTPKLSVSQREHQQPDAELDVDIRQQFSADHPARLRVSFTNTADHERQIEFGPSPPFSEYRSMTLDLVVIPEDFNFIEPSSETETETTDAFVVTRSLVPSEPQDGCWEIENEFGHFAPVNERALLPGETIRREYTVLNSVEGEPCLPKGDHEFVSADYFDEETPWGFTIHIEE